MKLAIFQGQSIVSDVESNLQKMAGVINAAAAQGADIIVFPELFLTGYNMKNKTSSLAEPVNGPSSATIKKMAIRHNIGVLYGYPEKVGEECFNSAQMINSSGECISNFRKNHLFGPMEKEFFTPGNDIALFDLGGLTFGILICYDIEFPEIARKSVLSGANVILVPTATDSPYEEVATTVVRARAYENQVFVAYVNHSGIEDDITFIGTSGIIGPDGKDICRAGQHNEALMVTEINPEAFALSISQNTYLRDRRPELYI